MVCGVSRIGPSITPEQPGKLVEQKVVVRSGSTLQVFRNMANSLVTGNPECILITNDLWNQNIERLFSGCVLDEYIKVNPITSRPDSRCTKGRLVAGPLRPCCSRLDRRSPCESMRNRPFLSPGSKLHLGPEHRRNRVGAW